MIIEAVIVIVIVIVTSMEFKEFPRNSKKCVILRNSWGFLRLSLGFLRVGLGAAGKGTKKV